MADFEFFRVIGQPGRLRRTLFDFVPYWQGTHARFQLTLEATDDIEHESKFLYTVQYSDSSHSPNQQLSVPLMRKGDKRTYTLVALPMTNTGDTMLLVAEIMSNNSISVYKPVYSFHTTARSWLGLAIIAGVLAGAFATIGSILVRCYWS